MRSHQVACSFRINTSPQATIEKREAPKQERENFTSELVDTVLQPGRGSPLEEFEAKPRSQVTDSTRRGRPSADVVRREEKGGGRQYVGQITNPAPQLPPNVVVPRPASAVSIQPRGQIGAPPLALAAHARCMSRCRSGSRKLLGCGREEEGRGVVGRRLWQNSERKIFRLGKGPKRGGGGQRSRDLLENPCISWLAATTKKTSTDGRSQIAIWYTNSGLRGQSRDWNLG